MRNDWMCGAAVIMKEDNSVGYIDEYPFEEDGEFIVVFSNESIEDDLYWTNCTREDFEFDKTSLLNLINTVSVEIKGLLEQIEEKRRVIYAIVSELKLL